MTELPAWIIAQLEEEKRLKEQESQYEQLRIPLYDPAEQLPRSAPPAEDSRSGVIIIEL